MKMFNINYYILVQITNTGWSHLRSIYSEDELNLTIRRKKVNIAGTIWYRLQAYQVFELFHKVNLIDSNILIEDEAIREFDEMETELSLFSPDIQVILRDNLKSLRNDVPYSLKLPYKYVYTVIPSYYRKCYLRDTRIIINRLKARKRLSGPQVGDVVDGQRIAYIWPTGLVQLGHGRCHLYPDGIMSFSGGMTTDHFSIDELQPDGTTMAACWIFSNDQWEAHNATEAMVRVNQWKW